MATSCDQFIYLSSRPSREECEHGHIILPVQLSLISAIQKALLPQQRAQGCLDMKPEALLSRLTLRHDGHISSTVPPKYP